MRKNLPAALSGFDIIRESQWADHLMVVVFPKSTSSSYPMALEFAQGAAKYSEATTGKKIIHAVAFERTKEQVARASALLKIVMKWKGAQVFTSAGVADSYHVIGVLDCYHQSLAAHDRQAHCYVVHYYRYRSQDENHLIPCRYLDGWLHSIIGDQVIHPSEFSARVQALAVRKGCSWCPHFDPSKARAIPPREKEVMSSVVETRR